MGPSTRLDCLRRGSRVLAVLALGGLVACGDRPMTVEPRDVAGVIAPASHDVDLLEAADRHFLLIAAGNALFERSAAQLAQQRAQDPLVRDFATMLLTHHAATAARLESIARDKGIDWPDSAPPAKQAELAALARMSGESFDRHFVQRVGIDQRQSGIQLFEAASLLASDAALRGWASRTLPLLREQLAAARQLPSPSPARAVLLV